MQILKPTDADRERMGGYVTLPADWTARTAKPWVARAHAAAAALPAKQPRKKKATTK